MEGLLLVVAGLLFRVGDPEGDCDDRCDCDDLKTRQWSSHDMMSFLLLVGLASAATPASIPLCF